MLPDLAASLILAGAFIALGIFTVRKIQNTVYVNSNALSVIAAQFSQEVLEKQKNESLYQITAHSAREIDEKITLQENYTRALAAALTSIYSQKNNYMPHILPVLTKGNKPEENKPFITAAPGVNIKNIQTEAYLAANAEYMLNQSYTIMPDLTGAPSLNTTRVYTIGIQAQKPPVICIGAEYTLIFADAGLLSTAPFHFTRKPPAKKHCAGSLPAAWSCPRLLRF